MTRSLILLSCLFVFAAAPASSQNLFVGWGGSPNFGAPDQLGSACTATTGTNSIVISIVPPIDLPEVVGGTIDLLAVSGYPGTCDPIPPGSGGCVPGNLPPFWDLSAGGCRPGTVSAAPGFPGDPGTSGIEDAWGGIGIVTTTPWVIETLYGGYYGSPTPYTAGHYIVSLAMPFQTSSSLLAGHEYYVGTITFKNANPNGCLGCCQSVGFQPKVTIDLAGTTAGLVLTNSGPAFWQGSTSYACSVTPARTSTWGALKGAYR